MARDDLIDFLSRVHAETSVTGWDFSSLDGRMDTEETPWDFDAESRAALREAHTALDVGTGGGERLITHLESLGTVRPVVMATEGWPPNVPVARDALSPWGVDVLAYDPESATPLPLDDASVDLVLNRHEAVNWGEFARVLRPGGHVLTQQVAGDDAHELREWFGGEALYPEVQPDEYVAGLEAAGFTINDVQDWSGAMSFRDVATLVEYLVMVPWDVPDFDVREQADALRMLADVRPITVTQRRFRIIATRV